MNYKEFIESKKSNIIDSGFELKESELNPNLFDFQKHIVKIALKKGRFAIFADCGLGKTIMQLSWADQVAKHTNKPVLVLCPLAVAKQTINEGHKFGISLSMFANQSEPGIYIINYEQLKNIDCNQFAGVVLDESSILKNFTGKYKRLIIEKFQETPYKLCCTATPSPNDFNELGNHSEFLRVLDATDMRSRWFVRDEGMNNYRLKGHAESDFFRWIKSWAIMISKPSDIGFNSEGYDLPDLNYKEYTVKTDIEDHGMLFNEMSVSATQFNRELKKTMQKRLSLVADIVNDSNENFIVWVNQNEEGKMLRELIPGSVEVKGSDSPEYKSQKLIGFGKNEFRVLITKKKIAQFGLNYQNCNNQIFASLDFSFEGLYQAIRRSYRFGQKKDVNIHLITTDTMKNVIASINRKQSNFNKMKSKMNQIMNEKEHKLKHEYTVRKKQIENFKIINGDCVIESKNIESDSIDFSIFSPPFSNLFTYSDNIHDMGNCATDDEFFQQYKYLVDQLYRIMKPGRLVAVHTKDLARYKNSSGFTGLWDFTGRNHRLFEDAGFKYHSKITIWTDPVLEMQRTKTQRLLYKQLRKDSSYTGIGLPEYVTIFRKWEGNEEDWTPITNKTSENFPLDTWQKWASPVWMDIKRTDVLTGWRDAKSHKDEKHICPLQLTVIRRCIQMWSNPGELVFSPFTGIGSEGYESIKTGRKFLGIELKPEYYDKAVKNLTNCLENTKQLTLF